MPPSSGSEGSPSPRKLSPFVLWSQTENSLCLRVSLYDVAKPDVSSTANSLEFSAHGTGANEGRNEYNFKFVFFQDIIPQVRVIKKSQEIQIQIKKKAKELWPRLTKEPLKPAWLKVDFDRLEAEEEEEEEANFDHMDPKFADMLADMENRQKKLQQTVERLRKWYLLLFNLFLFIGFFYCLAVMSLHYAKEGPDFMERAYPVVQAPFFFCLALQVLEIAHPLLGFTSGGALAPFLQVTGRTFMLVFMIAAEPRIQTKPAVFYLLYVYSLSEVFRYPYYMLRVFNIDFGLVTWLRYTVWIALYPLGFLNEGTIILRNIPYFEETLKYSLFLPNKWNISFYFPTFMRLYILLGLFPLLYFAMTHMYRQRVKVLGESGRLKRE